jgi:hypothetical protein
MFCSPEMLLVIKTLQIIKLFCFDEISSNYNIRVFNVGNVRKGDWTAHRLVVNMLRWVMSEPCFWRKHHRTSGIESLKQHPAWLRHSEMRIPGHPHSTRSFGSIAQTSDLTVYASETQPTSRRTFHKVQSGTAKIVRWGGLLAAIISNFFRVPQVLVFQQWINWCAKITKVAFFRSHCRLLHETRLVGPSKYCMTVFETYNLLFMAIIVKIRFKISYEVMYIINYSES